MLAGFPISLVAFVLTVTLFSVGVGTLIDDFTLPGGAFYLFAKAPRRSGTEFVTEAIDNNLLIIPGGTFSKRDTHFRISYAASDAMIDRGIEILRLLAR